MPELEQFLDTYMKMIEDAKLLKASGQRIFQVGIRSLSVDELKLVREMLNKKDGRKCSSEETLMKIAGVVYPPLKLLEIATKKVAKLREEMIAEVCGFFADEYIASLRLAPFAWTTSPLTRIWSASF